MKKFLLISEKPSLMVEVMKAFPKSEMSKKIQVDSFPLHGHCCTLAEPEFYDEKYKDRFNVDNLPIIPEKFVHVTVDKKLTDEIRQKVKDNNYDGYINCCDPEREGQNIFWSLMDYLNIKDKPIYRIWMEDTTQEKLIHAWNNLRNEANDKDLINLTHASLLRAEFDWLIGMNASRALGISSGRVMTPTEVSILAKREEEIANFKPTSAYDVYAEYKGDFVGKYNDKTKEDDKVAAFASEDEAINFIKGLKNEGEILECSIKNSKENAPLLYSTAELQSDASKKFGYRGSQVLNILEKLYNAPLSILTYPRTDSSYITEAIAKNELPKMLKACRNIPELKDVESDPDTLKNYIKSKYVNNKKVAAHAAITLTGKDFDFAKLSKEEQNIVTLVAKRMLATTMKPALYNNTVLDVDISGNLFKTNQKILIEPNYLSLYGKKKEDGIDFSDLKKGQRLTVNNFDIKKVTTTCPPRYNDGTLLKAMVNIGNTLEDKEMAEVLKGETPDQGGIGTPATRAAIIDKLLIERNHNGKKEPWVTLKGKSFVVTDFGMKVAKILDKYPISSALLTAEWEKRLKEVEQGERDPEAFREEMNKYIVELTDKMKANKVRTQSSSAPAVAINVNCPCCGKQMKESDKAYFCEDRQGCGFGMAKEIGKVKITKKDLKDLLKDEKTEVKEFTSKTGSKFNASVVLNKAEKKVEFKFENKEKDTGLTCRCKKGTLKELNGKFGPYLKCNECGLSISKEYLGYKLKKEEVEKLLDNKNIELRGLKGKSGKQFNANVRLGENKIEIIDFVN